MAFFEFLKLVGIVLLISWIVPALFCFLLSIVLYVCGCGSAGIRGHSFASGWQSHIGDVEADSPFALFQSLGATRGLMAIARNILAAPVVFLFSPVGLIILATVSGLVYYFCYYSGCDCSFEGIRNGTSNANITSSIANSTMFENTHSDANVINLNSNLLCVEALFVTCLTLFRLL